MTESDDPPFERVLVENDWWDGPVSGIALIGGKPHRFEVCRDDDGDVTRTYLVAPVDDATLALEVESFQIFARWNDRFERGEATLDTHPASSGCDERYNALQIQLAAARAVPFVPAVRMTVALRRGTGPSRYSLDGPDYEMQWTPLPAD